MEAFMEVCLSVLTLYLVKMYKKQSVDDSLKEKCKWKFMMKHNIRKFDEYLCSI